MYGLRVCPDCPRYVHRKKFETTTFNRDVLGGCNILRGAVFGERTGLAPADLARRTPPSTDPPSVSPARRLGDRKTTSPLTIPPFIDLSFLFPFFTPPFFLCRVGFLHSSTPPSSPFSFCFNPGANVVEPPIISPARISSTTQRLGTRSVRK